MEKPFLNHSFTACLLKNNHIFIGNNEKTESIRIYDFKGNKIKDITINKNYGFHSIQSFYDKKLKKNFVLLHSYKKISSFNYDENKLYQTYYKKEKETKGGAYFELIINEYENIVKLIGANSSLNMNPILYDIIIWNFHTGEKIKVIRSEERLSPILLWNNEILFAIKTAYMINDNEDSSMSLVDLKNEEIIDNIIDFKKNQVHILKKIFHPNYGECLLVKGFNFKISLWKIKQ